MHWSLLHRGANILFDSWKISTSTIKTPFWILAAEKAAPCWPCCKFPFARVDGIELSKEISEIAIRNLTKLKKQRWQIFNGDAIAYKDYNAYSMLYLYNPFREEVMRQVVENIHSSISDSEQEMLVIYNNPVCHEVIVKNGVFCKQREYPNGWGDRIFVYSNKNLQHSRLHRGAASGSTIERTPRRGQSVP